MVLANQWHAQQHKGCANMVLYVHIVDDTACVWFWPTYDMHSSTRGMPTFVYCCPSGPPPPQQSARWCLWCPPLLRGKKDKCQVLKIKNSSAICMLMSLVPQLLWEIEMSARFRYFLENVRMCACLSAYICMHIAYVTCVFCMHMFRVCQNHIP